MKPPTRRPDVKDQGIPPFLPPGALALAEPLSPLPTVYKGEFGVRVGTPLTRHAPNGPLKQTKGVGAENCTCHQRVPETGVG
ncbi:hypothetical protein Pcinc_039901 [Petrolisthes cinctipes]|uniref:Uncharacterized protein n=1 Tax=Petrolisthes cinctipes TaxID=88211 RepID=A0AAE1EIP0_PETCI|nr:hypothetical protein Pcinc_039901 [Petrolisthes cinctipes]